jgi:hypothetical protein
MNSWQTILLAFSGNAALVAVLGYLGKSLLERIIVRDTKRFETELRAKSDITMERLKNELQLSTVEHQVRFSRLHEKRAEVIADLYGLLVEALWEAESFLSPMEWAGEPAKKEKHQTAMSQLVKLYRYFDQHRIYLPRGVCASLEKLISEVRSQVINFGVYVNFGDSSINEEFDRNKREAWASGWRSIKNEVPLARNSLENEFRALLGHTEANPAPATDG